MQSYNGPAQRVAGLEDLQLLRAELDFVVEKLARSPRLASLLRYIGDKALQGNSEDVREYTIATEVFGRPSTFVPGEDAIARVEAHRLRKKLKEFYDSEGRDRAIRVSLPQGSYVPVFVAAEPAKEAMQPAREEPRFAAKNKRRSLAWYSAGAVVLITLCAGLIFLTKRKEQKRPNSVPAITTNAPALAAPGPEARILAGYWRQPHIGSGGVVWRADEYYHGGRPSQGPHAFVARTNDPILFQSMREGEFSYDIPLRPGVYELHLYFVEMTFGPGLEGGGELSRTFSVLLNGKPLLPGFDIESDAMGGDVADEKVFRDIAPAPDGRLHLAFESDRGQPILNAIAVIPGTPHKQLPVRLVTQQSPYIDHAGQLWSADNYFFGGVFSPQRNPVSGTSDPPLYSRERFGHFTYAIPVDVRDRYTITLHYAEFFFGPKASGYGGIGSRRFNVYCNGSTLIENYDILKEVGSYHAVTKTFRHVKPSAQGKLNLTFEPITNYATVSAMEVLDENE